MTVAVYAKLKKVDEDATTVRYLLDDGKRADRIVTPREPSSTHHDLGTALASVGALAQDFETFAGELGKMRTHIEGDVVDGMDAATSGVKSVTERLKSQHGCMLNDPVPSRDDNTEVEQGQTRWQMAYHAVEQATDDLKTAVSAATECIGGLSDHLKSDQDPVNMTYGPPPKSFHGL